MKKILLLLTCPFLLAVFVPVCAAATDGLTAEKIATQLASPARSDEDRARDAYRKPLQTLEFFDLRDDMRVVELLPGTGWYTQILAPVLKDRGKLYVAIGTRRLEPRLDELGLRTQVELVGKVEGFERTDLPGFVFDIGSVDLEVKDVDLVLTFRNLHNLSVSGRKAVNDAVFQALKPGGIYGVIDHTRRHMESVSEETWRRMDPVLVIKEMLDAGFEFVAYSDLHAVAADGLVFDTTHETLQTNSDRFTFKFRKPE